MNMIDTKGSAMTVKIAMERITFGPDGEMQAKFAVSIEVRGKSFEFDLDGPEYLLSASSESIFEMIEAAEPEAVEEMVLAHAGNAQFEINGARINPDEVARILRDNIEIASNQKRMTR